MKLVGYNSQMETTIDSLRSTAVLLVGFFARVRASVLAIVVASATAVGLAACGGGGGGDVRDPRDGGGLNPTAYFHGAERVAGLEYEYEGGGSGETDTRGGFPIEQGKTVVFSIGNTEIGAMTVRSDAQNEIVTPLHIGDRNRAIKIEQLLIALDTDTGSELIDLRGIAESDTENLLEIGELDNGGEHILPSDRRITILSVSDASDELKETNNCAYSGVFAGNFGDDNVAIVLMPNLKATLTVGLDPELTLTNASPIVSFINGEGGEVDVGETVLAIDLKIPPLTATVELDDDTMAMGTIILASYDRIEFRADGTLGVVRRVAGDPNADYRLAGIDGKGGGAFLADIYDGRNAQISYIDSSDTQEVLSATYTGVFPTVPKPPPRWL